MESVVERAARRRRITRHNDTNVASDRDADHRVPDFQFDAARFICNDQDVLAMVSLEVLGLVYGQPSRKVVVASQLQLNPIELGVGNLRARNDTVSSDQS